MIAPETLLRMHPLDALRAQIGEQLKAPLKSSYLKIQPPVSLGGTLTSVSASIDKSKTPVELWGLDGKLDFQYTRLDVEAFTSGISRSVKSSLPVTSDQVLRAILSPYSIPVDVSDVAPAEYTSYGEFDLIAAERSWRWVGEVQVMLNVLQLDINTCILADVFSIPFDRQFYSDNIKARLVTFLNLSNVSSLPEILVPSMFDVGVPEVNGPIAKGDNTKLPLIFRGTPYTNTLNVYYQRRGFEKTFTVPVKLSGGQLSNTQQLAAQLSAQMGCTITADDILSEPFPQMSTSKPTKLAVNFNPTSLAYVGTVLVQYSRTT